MGGTHFLTTRATLEKDGDSFLSKLASCDDIDKDRVTDVEAYQSFDTDIQPYILNVNHLIFAVFRKTILLQGVATVKACMLQDPQKWNSEKIVFKFDDGFV